MINQSSAISRELTSAWPNLEKILSEAVAFPGFSDFLENYRGHAIALAKPPDHAQSAMGEALVSFFVAIFQNSGFAQAVQHLSLQEIQRALDTTEQQINLGLYYWFGQQDRNFQFRTIVHFCNLEGVGGPIFSTPNQEWFVSFSEDGIRFGVEGDDHIPQTAPAFFAYGLHELNASKIAQNPNGFQKPLLARLRSLQREICLVEEEWEHRNAILAVEHGRVRDAIRNNRCAETEKALDANTQRLTLFRDLMAQWMLKTFVGVEQWSSEVAHIFENKTDIAAEFDALDAVITSGLQKIFLPASVSRHQYCSQVVQLFLSWAELRLKRTPDCLACHLLRDTARLALGITASAPESPAFLEKKNFEWVFSFDPSSALKAFSRGLTPLEHKTFTAITTVGIAQKISPSPLDNFWIMNLASLADMPNSFPDQSVPRPTRPLAFTIAISELLERAHAAVQESRVELEGEESREYLSKFFSAENAQ